MFGFKRKSENSPSTIQSGVALGKSTVKVLALRPIGFLQFQAHKVVTVARRKKPVDVVCSSVQNTCAFIKEGVDEGYVNSRQSFVRRQIIKAFNKAETDEDIAQGISRLKTFLTELSMSQSEVEHVLRSIKEELSQGGVDFIAAYS